MVYNFRSAVLFGTFLFISFLSNSFAQDATEIVKKMDQQMRGDSQYAEVSMTIVRPDWERTISMKSWSKGQDYSMIYITAPARDEGTAFLKRQNEIWNWVPNVGRTIKMPPSMMMQSWMGSDFTNDDLVRESSVVNDYTHELDGEEEVDGYACYKITMKPKPDAPVIWDKVVAWITKDHYLELKAEFYDEFGELINVMNASDIQSFDGRELPAQMEMIPVEEEGQKTVLRYKTISFNENIPKSFFTIQQMRRLE